MEMLTANLRCALFGAIRDEKGTELERSIYLEGLRKVLHAIDRGEKIEIVENNSQQND